MSSTHRGAQRSPGDFYRTPSWCVQRVYEELNLPEPTLDPCAGDGALLAPFLGRVRGVELNDDLASAGRAHGRRIETGDGLKISWEGEHIIINPPYGHAEQWVEKGVSEPESCLALLRLGYLSSKRRYPFWKANPPAAIAILSRRPSFTDDGKSDSADYCWVFWQKNSSPGPTRMVWLLPHD